MCRRRSGYRARNASGGSLMCYNYTWKIRSDHCRAVFSSLRVSESRTWTCTWLISAMRKRKRGILLGKRITRVLPLVAAVFSSTQFLEEFSNARCRASRSFDITLSFSHAVRNPRSLRDEKELQQSALFSELRLPNLTESNSDPRDEDGRKCRFSLSFVITN
jgi:hypothetical protein